MFRAALSLVVLGMLAGSVIAAEEIIVMDVPSLELLEYLGAMVEDEGELIGPADLDESGEATLDADRDDSSEPAPMEWISRD